MVLAHGMDIQCRKESSDNLSFYIQASNPSPEGNANISDVSLSDAIESAFPLNTESAILVWNYIGVPLSYKYDISYMMEDVLGLLYTLQNREKGESTIHWLPDTFRCDWIVSWDAEIINIQSHWECTVGHLEKLLNQKPYLSLLKNNFISEWKSVLGVVITGLKSCGYNENMIRNMNQLIEQHESIKENGILYKHTGTVNARRAHGAHGDSSFVP